jgi:hypothetical protein
VVATNPNGFCYEAFNESQSFCACRSGFSGEDCATEVGGACSGSFGSVNVVATGHAPVSIDVFFDADVLNVGIVSPLVTERNYSLVFIDNSVADNENCTYPGTYWSRSFSTCNDIFTGAMPWSDNDDCGWDLDNTSPSLAVYSSQMVVEHHDFVDPFGTRNSSEEVERITQHIVPLTISFPKNITINSAITVQSPVRLLAAISRQSVVASGASATIELATNLLWPYQLTAFTITSNPGTATSYTPSLVSNTCPNDGSSSCTQVFRIAIVTGSACTLNGNYALSWTLTCQQTGGVNPAQCAIQAGATATASLVVVSEDFCATISTVTPLSGSLAAFGDGAHSIPKTQYLVGQTLFFRATVISTNVTLTGTTINSVKLTSAGQPDVLLYSGLVLGADGTDASFSAPASTANSADFQFTLTNDFIAALADDSARTYTTRVIVDVDFLNVITTKRGVQSIEFASTLNEQPVALSASFSAQQESGATAISSALAFAFAFAFTIFKLF